VIIADTGAIIALLDRDDRHHHSLRQLFEARPRDWMLPWAILPEVDYLVTSHLGSHIAEAFLADVVDGDYRLDWGEPADLSRALALCKRYRDLEIGLVDAVVMATAERRRASAIATLDVRHFGVVKLATKPQLFPRDLERSA
jgi:predicted nucleic acid-binding protein